MKSFVFSVTLGLSLLGGAPTVVATEAVSAAQIEIGKAVFIKDAVPNCALCHTLKDADAAGTIGPDLDELKPGVAAVLTVLRSGIGVMPSFAETLTDEQIQAVAAYVVHATTTGSN